MKSAVVPADAAKAYERVADGKARFRAVLTMQSAMRAVP
jgi:D-arabinose 1-dehydrogenase-like Zn-dependent alcohol dehydrogenase